MTKQSPLTYATNGLAALRDNLRGEFVGALLVILGGFLLWRVAAYVPGDGSPPLLTTLTGWTAPLFAASLVIIGLVLIFRRRAGYWSAEALIGVELLLLGLMALVPLTLILRAP